MMDLCSGAAHLTREWERMMYHFTTARPKVATTFATIKAQTKTYLFRSWSLLNEHVHSSSNVRPIFLVENGSVLHFRQLTAIESCADQWCRSTDCLMLHDGT
jgi:hypothetical protein